MTVKKDFDNLEYNYYFWSFYCIWFLLQYANTMHCAMYIVLDYCPACIICITIVEYVRTLPPNSIFLIEDTPKTVNAFFTREKKHFSWLEWLCFEA